MATGNLHFPQISICPWKGISSAGIVRALGADGEAVIWENAERTSSRSRFRYIGLYPRRGVEIADGSVRYFDELKEQTLPLEDFNNNPLAPVAEKLHSLKRRATPAQVEEITGLELPPFLGGLMGFLSYDAGRCFEHIKGAGAHPKEPEAYFLAIDDLLVIDTERRELIFISWPSEDRTVEARELGARIKTVAKSAFDEFNYPNADLPSLTEKFDREQFVQMVERAREYIFAGDVFQVVVSNAFELSLGPNPLACYEALLRYNPSPYHFLIPFAQATLLGASPEQYLQSRVTQSQDGVEIAMRLVAGTYPRGKTEAEEAAQYEALQNDEKERAEHIMLVDHARNDIGKVSEIGSVQVQDLLNVEPYVDVLHLVSEVNGRLRKGESVLSAVTSCFPIATLTGTPKIRAMEIIAELEGPYRGVFGGSVLLLGHDGYLDAAVIIRSAVINRNARRTTIRAGAGIVADSNPEREYHECRWKAEAVLRAVAAAAGTEGVERSGVQNTARRSA